jgi:hypothetical protein
LVFWRLVAMQGLGTRTIIAIPIDSVEVVTNSGNHEVEGNRPDRRQTHSRSEAESDGWFNGPPHAVAEIVFDEYDLAGCSLDHESDDTIGIVGP